MHAESGVNKEEQWIADDVGMSQCVRERET